MKVLFLIAAAMTAISLLMMLYEYRRNRSKRPISKGERVMMPYWITYLALIALGPVLMLRAILS